MLWPKADETHAEKKSGNESIAIDVGCSGEIYAEAGAGDCHDRHRSGLAGVSDIRAPETSRVVRHLSDNRRWRLRGHPRPVGLRKIDIALHCWRLCHSDRGRG